MAKANVPVSDEILKGIGKVCVNFSMLENSVSTFISILISGDFTIGQIITNARLGFRGLLSILQALYHHKVKDPDKITSFDNLIARAHQLEEERNQIVHSRWGVEFPKKVIIRGKTKIKKQKLVTDTFEVSEKELYSMAESIGDLSYDFHELMVKFAMPDLDLSEK